MRKEAYILSGMLFGDEGKGTFIDYLAKQQNISQFIRYNGGSQASHTVISKSGTHKFSQLSSGTLATSGNTYLSENTIVNPINLLNEIEEFANKFNRNPKDILNCIYINNNAYIVTPYHKLINRLKELSAAYIRRGSVGTGVSEVLGILREINLGIKFGDLYDKNTLEKKINKLKLYSLSLLDNNISLINQDDYKKLIDSNEVNYLLDDSNPIVDKYLDMVKTIPFNIVDFDTFINNSQPVIFEGSQGLLLDYNYGIRPNTTLLDTTSHHALNMINPYDYKQISIGIVSVFTSRHGLGVLPTETKELLIKDKNQETSFWQGSPRYGWFDAVLFRYSQRINKVDELYLSSVDLLSNIGSINICNEYEYSGEITDEFNCMFEYYRLGKKIIIKNIKNNSGDISYYLIKMKPIYTIMNGWETDISNIKSIDTLPVNCQKYIDILEELIGVKITTISVGPTREQKIRRMI